MMIKLYQSFSTLLMMNNFSLRFQVAFYYDFETRRRDERIMAAD